MTTVRAMILLVASGLLASPTIAHAQGGPDGFGYTWTPSLFDWVDPPAGSTPVTVTADDQEQILALPWAFFFYGEAYDYVTVSDNGALKMSDGVTTQDITFANSTLPSNGAFDADVAIYWDDLNISEGGDVFVHHDVANDRFVISWLGMPHFSYGGAISFQAHLRPSGHIELHYLDTEFGSSTIDFGASATIGIQDSTGGNSGAGSYLEIDSFSPVILNQTGYSITSPCTDNDGDGHAALGDTTCLGTDCDDANATVYPGAPETCSDGIDQNCNGYDQLTDFDQDGDIGVQCGGSDCNDFDPSTNSTIDSDGDGVSACDDCDDNAASVFPGATEVCDGADNDCDGVGDDFTDADGDGTTVCQSDCDDNDASVHPSATEVCGDFQDNDCDGIEENRDADADGFVDQACGGLDCDDQDANFRPDAPELCDGIDTDCDGLADGNDLDIGGVSTHFAVSSTAVVLLDASATGNTIFTSGINVITTAGGDIQDIDIEVQINHSWVGDLTVTITSPQGTVVLLSDQQGEDGDNYTDTVFDDDASIGITAASPPFTGSFQPVAPLSTLIDEQLSGIWTLTVIDNFPTLDDGAIVGWSVSGTAMATDDDDLDGYVDSCGDCDSTDPTINPASDEICDDGIDQDCDGGDLLDDVDGDGVSAEGCNGTDCDDNDPAIFPGADFDGDGYGPCLGDCDDQDSSANPGGVEICDDGIDQDCLGGGDLLSDIDGDGEASLDCGGLDCDDEDATISPSAADAVCDTIDHNCDGLDLDVDGDGDGDQGCDGSDCDDSDPTIASTAQEICDGADVDNDCDGLSDLWDLDIGANPPTISILSGSLLPAVVGDGSPYSETVTSMGLGRVIDLSIEVDISHPRVSDLRISLQDPTGQSLVLADGVGGNGVDFTGTFFVDGGGLGPIGQGSPPFTGSYAPETPLSTLMNQPAAGFWTLSVEDDISGEDGTVNSWTLRLTAREFDDFDYDGSPGTCGDCDDADPNVYPGALEICADGIDQNCDGQDAQIDVDGDGWLTVLCGGADCDDTNFNISPDMLEGCNDGVDNDCDPSTPDLFDGDGDGSTCVDDCDDASPLAYPGFAELCFDGEDNDCDPSTPDDADLDGDGVNCQVDCDDSNPVIYPGAPEVLCTGFEEDCTAAVNPDVADGDGDGATCIDDCDDTAPAVFPGAVEIPCDGIDNDCDEVIDADDGMVTDADGDGATCDVDCDDNDAGRSPDFEEICDDTIDNDCDPLTGDDLDADGDGFNCNDDCDDQDSLIYPGAPEICGDSLDQDCDGAVDELAADTYTLGDSDSLHIDICSFSFPFCGENWSDIYVQDNGRITFGFDDPSSQEGIENFLTQVPQLASLWTDLDPSIAGTIQVDELEETSLTIEYVAVPQFGLPGTANTFTITLWDDGRVDLDYFVLDATDGFVGWACGDQETLEIDLSEQVGLVGSGTEDAIYEHFSSLGDPNDLQGLSLELCMTSGVDIDGDGWTDACGDCNDADPSVNPGAPELCNAADDDCNGVIDDVDVDEDGHIDINCFGDDCDDTAVTTWPSAPELCNGVDDDCDGEIEVEGTDFDLDGYLLCQGDCDDGDMDVNPGAEEICDLDAFGNPLDNDCDGIANNGFEMDLDQDGYISQDCGGNDCADERANAYPGAEEICDLVDNDCNGEADDIDADGDTFNDANCAGDDCNDLNDSINPGAVDVPYDGVDSDCSGQDLVDVDGDGYESDHIAGGLDCDDDRAGVNPDAFEICDDLRDNDCDGLVDIDDEACGACADCASNLSSSGEAEALFPGMLLLIIGLTRRRRRSQ